MIDLNVLRRVLALSQTYERLIGEEKALRSDLAVLPQMQELPQEEQGKWLESRKVRRMLALMVIFSIVIEVGGSCVSTIIENWGRRYIISQMMFNPILAILLAIPCSLGANWLMERRAKQKTDAQTEQLQAENRAIARERQHLSARNKEIASQLELVRKEKDRIVGELEQTAPWFPKAFFQPRAVDYAIRYLSTYPDALLEDALTDYQLWN